MGINYKTDTHKGYYEIINKAKYYPSGKVPIYKSGWELEVFHGLDINPNVLAWGYEPMPIYYYSPKYMRYTDYWPDIICHIRMDGGTERKYMIEIKPASMTVMPKKPNPPSGGDPNAWRKYQKAMATYGSKVMDFMVNTAKWEAAQVWCAKNNVFWKVLNEKNTVTLFK